MSLIGVCHEILQTSFADISRLLDWLALACVGFRFFALLVIFCFHAVRVFEQDITQSRTMTPHNNLSKKTEIPVSLFDIQNLSTV
jgi:hypothetical protein